MHRLSGVHVDKGILRRDLTSAAGIDSKEIEANAFAATVLMPSSLIAAYTLGGIDLENDRLVSNLARTFGVSATALTNRILNLSSL